MGERFLSAVNQPMEERILDAAERCFERFGIAKTTVKDVAEDAGISHMTIYRKFTDRDELFAAASLRLLDRRWGDIAEKLSDINDLDTWLLEALIANWRLMQEEQPYPRYQKIGAFEQGMNVLLREPGLECLIRHFEHLLKGKRRRAASQARDIAEWLHWMSYIMACRRSVYLQTEKDWRRWLGRQIAGGM